VHSLFATPCGLCEHRACIACWKFKLASSLCVSLLLLSIAFCLQRCSSAFYIALQCLHTLLSGRGRRLGFDGVADFVNTHQVFNLLLQDHNCYQHDSQHTSWLLKIVPFNKPFYINASHAEACFQFVSRCQYCRVQLACKHSSFNNFQNADQVFLCANFHCVFAA